MKPLRRTPSRLRFATALMRQVMASLVDSSGEGQPSEWATVIETAEAASRAPRRVFYERLTTAVTGEYLRVPGRPRGPLVRIETSEQRELIEQARALVGADGLLRSKPGPLRSALRDLRYRVTCALAPKPRTADVGDGHEDNEPVSAGRFLAELRQS